MTERAADQVEVRTRAELRDWLAAHHDTAGTVWLVYYKKHTPHYLPFDAYVEELLCWGWVDSVTRRVDDARTSVRISPRNPKSAWSAVNKRLIEMARASGAMTEPGEAAIDRGKANGMWSFLDDVEALVVPDDLAKALGAARVTWDAGPRSLKRAWLERIKTAKTTPTREKRLRACAEAARAGDLKRDLS